MVDFDHGYTEYQSNRSALRKLVRRVYLRSARLQLRGATLDFGCGVGELLAQLPTGSLGLEYNQATVEYCRGKGLGVCWYDGMVDDWQLSAVPPGRHFESMIISHVLEHLDEPVSILRLLLAAARKLGVERVLVIVPGRAGYRIDSTHRTFIDRAMLIDAGVVEGSEFAVESARYFPGNLEAIGHWFPHHELQVLYVVK